MKKVIIPQEDLDNEVDEIEAKDILLFKRMDAEYVSEEERYFFEKMHWKLFEDFAPCSDVLIDESQNDEELYFVRYYTSEFEVGTGFKGNRKLGGYFICLSDALELNLSELLGRDITMLGWLRERNYQGIKYDNNNLE